MSEQPNSATELLQTALASFLAAQKEQLVTQRRESRFKMIRSAIVALAIVGWAVFSIASGILSNDRPGHSYATAVRLDGLISPDSTASITVMQDALERAFSDKDALGVALVINSPGGYPGQSELIYEAVKALSSKYGKRVIAVAEDQVTSGAYLIAMSADKVYAPLMATVGSIGVVQQALNFSGLAEKYGIEDMTYTAGSAKHRFNPWTPPTETDKKKAADFLGQLHGEFIDIVMASRGERLKGDPAVVFSGDFWTGRQAEEMGLIDGHIGLMEALEKEFGATGIRVIEPRVSLGNLLRMAGKATPF